MSDDVDKEGFLYKKPGKGEKKKFVSKGLKYYYVNLIGGSLHYYKDAEVFKQLPKLIFIFLQDAEPKGSIALSDLAFTAEFRKAEKQEKDGESGQWVLRLSVLSENDNFENLNFAERESRVHF